MNKQLKIEQIALVNKQTNNSLLNNLRKSEQIPEINKSIQMQTDGSVRSVVE